jgi:hypothetical protein
MAGVSVCLGWKLASRCVFLLTPERSGWSRLRPASGEAFRQFSTPHPTSILKIREGWVLQYDAFYTCPSLGAIFENPGRISFMMNYSRPLPCRHFENPGRIGFTI